MDPAFTTNNADRRDDVRLDFPGAVGAGASWRPRSALTISADYTRTFWSEGRIRNFFTVPARLVGQPRTPTVVFPELPYPTLDDEEQFDTAQLRLGVEYVVIGSRIKVPLRAGFFTDRQYFADGAGEIPTFLGFSVGTGIILGPVLFDLAYVREQSTYVDPDLTGGSVTSAFSRIFVSLIYRHGG